MLYVSSQGTKSFSCYFFIGDYFLNYFFFFPEISLIDFSSWPPFYFYSFYLGFDFDWFSVFSQCYFFLWFVCSLFFDLFCFFSLDFDFFSFSFYYFVSVDCWLLYFPDVSEFLLLILDLVCFDTGTTVLEQHLHSIASLI